MKYILVIMLGFAVCALLWIPGCTKPNGTGTCDTTNLTYRKDILPILQNYCFVCHSNGNMAFSNNTGYNFQQGDSLGYSYFKSEGGIVVHNVRHDPGYIGMPYMKPKLPQCEIDKMTAWFNNPLLPY
jgi:hypothetical protein